ncbi:MAG: DUF6352 family protein [Bosea sp. (in: a-proteobacteria)]
MTHFWAASGHLLLDRAADGALTVTDDYLIAYLARPEIVPPEEACDAERALHARLLASPRASVSEAEIAALADPDAQENWRFLVKWRDRLLAAPTLQGAYATMIRKGVADVPPLFLDQLVQVILRSALDVCEDPFVVRAAECFFRPQRVTFHENTILLADAEMIEGHEADRHASPLLAMLGGPAATSLDILKTANADGYWQRSDAFDMVLDLGGKPSGRSALAAAIKVWIKAVHGFDAEIGTVDTVEDKDWRWFAGLDAEASAIGKVLWEGKQIEPEQAARMLGLFTLRFSADVPLLTQAKGAPVYLILAMDKDNILRLKPQNLVTGLPLATASG